ncbi:MAG: DUF5615 family PIN-like protein [bacterium]|nr:DUF5615 family PIN-like protein [bacterium]MCY3890791.1 DUF5615 family PIN-like protein [bacterium]MCY3962519.1 DUF5615 family PIN-like protein [bacterium]
MRWLIDEMLPPSTSEELNALGHDAISVSAVGLAGADDELVYAEALRQSRVVVTENFSDFAAIAAQRLANDDPCVPVVLVRKADHPRGGALAHHLARHLHQWAAQNPNPYPGTHWP